MISFAALFLAYQIFIPIVPQHEMNPKYPKFTPIRLPLSLSNNLK